MTLLRGALGEKASGAARVAAGRRVEGRWARGCGTGLGPGSAAGAGGEEVWPGEAEWGRLGGSRRRGSFGGRRRGIRGGLRNEPNLALNRIRLRGMEEWIAAWFGCGLEALEGLQAAMVQAVR